MIASRNRSLYVLTVAVIVLGTVVSAIGLFSTTGGEPFEVTNVFGDTVRLWGDGLYTYDSYVFAPVFRGTDLSVLVVAIPALIVALVLDVRRRTLGTRLFLMSVLSIFTYYAVSISFGVVYNVLHLAYIALFSATFFSFAIALTGIDKVRAARERPMPYPWRGLYVFLGFVGLVLIVAWLPDIIASISAGRPPQSIESYTTSVTNVLDLAIIGPVSLLTIYWMRRGNGLGYVLAPVLLTLCTYIGIMVVSQTAFQIAAGIDLPLPVMITKAASFVALACFAAYLDVRFFRGLGGARQEG